jgi:chromosome partition protein MukF
MTSSDPNRVLASLARDRVTLDLKTVDVGFLAALYLKGDKAALASFDEDQLIDLFEQVCDVLEPGAENPRKRATHAIQRLRDQRMLARIDGRGIVNAGDYTLTTLGSAIVRFFLDDEALTRESLTLLTGTLRGHLAELLAQARSAKSTEAWRDHVAGPLRVTVSELVGGIERRQRGLDAQQEALQAEISMLLSQNWFEAVGHCEDLLEKTTGTLRELNEILLRDTNHLLALLQDIQNLAATAEQVDAEAAAQHVTEHVDRIGAWGRSRQDAWSDYYQYVHRYLRDVVRLDEDRALSQRLRDQLAAWPMHPFHLLIANSEPIRLLRPLEPRVDRPAVAQTRTNRDTVVELVDPEDLSATIDALAAESVAGGGRTLSTVTAEVLPTLPEPMHYVAIGRVTESIAKQFSVRCEREQPWSPVSERIEIGDWTIHGPRGNP